MVMAPEEAVRRNRLALIAQVLESFSHIGDVSEVIIA
jgi:glycyl-tRNA synthetase beta subunit